MTDAPPASTSPPATPGSRPGSRLTSDVPWPGLAPYREADRDFFFGRSRETAELLRIVRRDPFVLLTGGAGVGKTSLLLAGVFPVLREEGFLPVRVRLDWSDAGDERPLSAQVLECLAAAGKSEDVDGGNIAESDSLWEAFHRAGQRWWNARQQVVVPVLVIDQAEELFTYGRDTLRRRQRTDRLIEELAQLVENRAPARVATLLEKAEQKPDAFSFEAAPVRIILSVREEILSQVRPLRGMFPSMGRSEQRLLPFSTAHAREAIAKPSAQNELLTEGAADAIVRMLADGSGSETPILPAHLSILGRELALARKQKGSDQISTDALQSGPSQLLPEYYERALAGLPTGARRLVEDHLVSSSGERLSRSMDEATAQPDVTPEVIQTMIDRLLLRAIPRRDGSRQLELVSDLLCPIVVQSRATWALTVRDEAAGRDRATFEKTAQSLRENVARQRRWTITFASLATLAAAAAAVAGGLWLGTQKNLARERANVSQLRQKALMLPVQPAEPSDAAVTDLPATPEPADSEPVRPAPRSETPVVNPTPIPQKPPVIPVPVVPPRSAPDPNQEPNPEATPPADPKPPAKEPMPADAPPAEPPRVEPSDAEKNGETERQRFLEEKRRTEEKRAQVAARRAERAEGDARARRAERENPAVRPRQPLTKSPEPTPNPPPRARPPTPISPLR